MSSKLVSSLARVYDPKVAPSRRLGKSPADVEPQPSQNLETIQVRIESLSEKMDTLIHIQEKVLHRLDGMSQDIGDIEQDVETLKVDKEEVRVPPAPVKRQDTGGTNQMKDICEEMTSIMSTVSQRTEQQARKLEGMEKLVLSIQEVISFIGETVKGSQLLELLFNGPASSKEGAKDHKGTGTVKRQVSADKGEAVSSKRFDKLREQKGREGKERPRWSLKGLKSQKKKKPPDSSDAISLKKQALLLEEVQQRNQQNTERSAVLRVPETQEVETGGQEEGTQASREGQGGLDMLDFIMEVPHTPAANQEAGQEEKEEEVEVASEYETEEEDAKKEEEGEPPKIEEAKKEEKNTDVTPVASEGPAVCEIPETELHLRPAGAPVVCADTPSDVGSTLQRKEESESAASVSLEEEPGSTGEVTTSSKRRVIEEDLELEDPKKSRRAEEGVVNGGTEGEKEVVVNGGTGGEMGIEEAVVEQKKTEPQVEEEEAEEGDKVDLEEWKKAWVQRKAELEAEEWSSDHREFQIDTSAPPSAPFQHRVVSAKPNQVNNFYTINRQEIVGGGRFGQVHKCIENSSGLTLAAKIIKARSVKEKEVVKNEIQVMNQLDHANLIQLYAAYESRNDIILVLEYVDGGELFDRIIDENYKLTELDTVHFIRQICDGLHHMHKMSVVHLDLKPENILCVSRVTNKIKIIDFGLARKYKPKEKLKVNFGTPEFLAPEVINYDFISFRTDMWSLGVITYMLLSSLSPFLGDDDNQTLNNILACQWGFEEEEFTDTSAEAKDFITKLLVVNKSWRLNAEEALGHSWLSDPGLHYRLHMKKNMCRSRRSSCVPLSDT